MEKQIKNIMPKQLSSIILIGIVNYIEKKYPEISVEDIVAKINNETPYYIENLQTSRIELVSIDHIMNESYWFSQLFQNAFFKSIQDHIPDPNFFYEVGRSLYRSQHFLKTAVGMPFVGPQKMTEYIQRENNKYNRTKDIEILKSENGHTVLKASYYKGIVPSPQGMQWGAGLLESYILLSGATGVEVSYRCIDEGPKKTGDAGQGIWEYEVKYKQPNIFKRLFRSFVLHLPNVRKELDQASEILLEHKEQILDREKIIKKKTNALKNANQKLLESDRLKTEFFTNITHELRTPLTLIKSQIEAIQKGHFGSSIKSSSELFKSVNQNADHLNKLINNLLDFSKIESGKMNVALEKTNLSKFLNHIISNVESAIEYKGLTFEFKDRIQHLDINLDKNLFEKAIYNILSNAIKFTPKGGNIVLLLDENEDAISISVKDTGVGIARENQEIIFERFRQADSSLTRKYEGTGIGLSLAMNIITMHGGDLKVDSAPGKGSTFTIIIPKRLDLFTTKIPKNEKSPDILDQNKFYASNKKIYSTAVKKNTNHETQRKNFTILIAEDNTDLCSFLKNMLIGKYTVHVSKNGLEALSKLDQNEIDLVITDIMMPQMDGLELLKNIRSNKKLSWLPVIMLTARADFSMKMKGFSHGVNDYIVKPFHPDELFARIHSQLSLVKLRRDYKSGLKNKNLTDKTIIAIKKVKKYIQSNYKENISRENLSSVVDMSPDHLSRMFKKYTNKRIHDFINELRIKSVLKELEKGKKKIVDIAFNAGFESLSSFNRIFKKLKGITPSKYKNQQDSSSIS